MENTFQDEERKIKEACAVFGIYAGGENLDCARLSYFALYAMQHRGQESCGIVVNNNREITYKKGIGLVSEVFNDENIDSLKGQMAVGHVRYATSGELGWENTQPLASRYVKGTLVVAHNGSLTNSEELCREFEKTGAIFQTTTDAEVIAYSIARARLETESIEDAILTSMRKLRGAYSLVIMGPQKLIAVRDPFGFRPLSIGKLGNAIIFASESVAFDSIGATFVRDVEPGEIVVIDQGEMRSIKTMCKAEKNSLCIFEYVYFARPDSVIEGQSVYAARKEAGRILAKESPVCADIVIGVPDSGLAAAVGYSEQSGIPYEVGLIKNRYIGRTFIQPDQRMRENSVRIKLNALAETVSGKRVIMIDDSIVRGTTSARLVELLKNAGAKEVHVRISSPPFHWPCFFGTDIPHRKHLAANLFTKEEIRQRINADSLEYMSLEGVSKMAKNCKLSLCDACFSGNYPLDVSHLLESK